MRLDERRAADREGRRGARPRPPGGRAVLPAGAGARLLRLALVRRRAAVPVRGEGAERSLRLVERPALRAVEDDPDSAAEAELEADLGDRGRAARPVEQRDAPGHVEAVEAFALSRADVGERREHAALR